MYDCHFLFPFKINGVMCKINDDKFIDPSSEFTCFPHQSVLWSCTKTTSKLFFSNVKKRIAKKTRTKHESEREKRSTSTKSNGWNNMKWAMNDCRRKEKWMKNTKNRERNIHKCHKPRCNQTAQINFGFFFIHFILVIRFFMNWVVFFFLLFTHGHFWN